MSSYRGAVKPTRSGIIERCRGKQHFSSYFQNAANVFLALRIGDNDNVAVLGDIVGSIYFDTFFVFESHEAIRSRLVICETSVVHPKPRVATRVPCSPSEERWRYKSIDVLVGAEGVVDDGVIPAQISRSLYTM
jgi:hypothetical protein